MNLRNVLRAYSLLRQMSDEELAQLEIWRGATDAERALIVEALSDKPQKKSSKKSAGKGGGKSAHGESIKGQLSNRRQERQVINDGGVGANLQPLPDVYTSGDDLCQFKFPNDIRCSEPQDRNIHHLQTTLGYHPFVSTAQAAESSSSQVTSATEKGAASSARQEGG